jgi:hypothetical protein
VPKLTRESRRTAAAAFVAATMLLSACASTPTDQVRISIKRLALSLAFKDEALAKPVPPETIINWIPAPDDLLATGDLSKYRLLGPAPLTPLCPKAPAGAPVDEAASATILKPPKPGFYLRQNVGKVGVTGGAIPITIPLPPITMIEISNVHDVVRPKVDSHAGDAADAAPPADDVASGAAGSSPAVQFTMSHQIATITVTDIYEYDKASFRLVSRTTKTDAGTSVFTPTPQIVLTELGNYGNDWNEGGTDRDTGTSMIVRGEMNAQERVDVCGTLVDSLHYENDEQMVNPQAQEVSGTQGTPNKYNIAPQKNGLIVREDKHYTQVVTVDGAKLALDWNYTSTAMNVEPYLTKAAAFAATFR